MYSEPNNRSDSEDEERKYYFDLQKFFVDDCTLLLRSLLEEIFPQYTVFLQKIPQEAYETIENPEGIITKKHRHLLEKECCISKKFKLDLLCIIFQTGVCDEYCGRPSVGWEINNEALSNPQNTGDDILQILHIWHKYISDEDTEDLSKTDSDRIWSILYRSAERLCERYPTFGQKFFRSIEKTRKKESKGEMAINYQCGLSNTIKYTSGENSTVECNQLGNMNRFSSRNSAPHALQTVICNQQGNECKIAITLEDQTNPNIGIDIEGKDLRLTLTSSDSVFNEIAEKTARLSINVLNKDACLQENSIELTHIQNACLIVDVRITNSETEIPLKMKCVVQCLIKHSDAFQILQDNDISQIDIFGYYYQPWSYINKTDLHLNFVLSSHVTLKLKNTISDVDIFVSDSLNQLIKNSFKTDVDENLRVQIKGKVVHPKNFNFSHIQKIVVDNAEHLQRMNVSLATECHLEVVGVLRKKLSTHIILKTVSCLTYERLMANKGPILVLLRKLLQLESVLEISSEISFMRIGLLINTSMDEDFEKDSEKGIVFHLRPGSRISDVVEEGKFHEVVLALVGEKNLQDVKQLKVRAVLDYANGRNNSDSDPAIDITEEYVEFSPEQKIKRKVDLAKNYLRSGNFIEAMKIARSVFHKLSDKDIDTFNELLKVFQQCSDNFYALRSFCKGRLLAKLVWDPLLSLLASRNYWLSVINGPYELQKIMDLFEEIEDMVLEYKEMDEYTSIATGILFELLLSYRQLVFVFHLQHDDARIIKRIQKVHFFSCTIFCKQGLNEQVCDSYKQLDRDRVALDVDNLFMWATALKNLGKIEVALKKIEEAIQIYNPDRTEMRTKTICNQKEIKDLHESLILQMNQISREQTDVDVEWLSGTNICLPQRMTDRAIQFKEQHVKKSGPHRRPKKQRQDQLESTSSDDFAKNRSQNKDFSEYKTWKDVPPHERTKPIRRKSKKGKTEESDFNVEIIETVGSESDSGQESSYENDGIQEKPFSYEAPEYKNYTDSESVSDSGFDTFDDESQIDPEDLDSVSTVKSLSNSELVVSGITLTDRCKESLYKRNKFEAFKYQEFLSSDELNRRLQSDKNKYKWCTVEIESAHKAVCKNIEKDDEVKEIIISGRSKCGRVFTDDEVVVEILGESKAPKNFSRLKIELAKETKDSNIYGRIIGRLKKNRFEDLEHPVLICAKDDLSEHSMKPLCRTVPKINVYHKNCSSKYQIDLFSYDSKRNIVEYRETLGIDQANKNAYCFLVAIIHWENMYPFGVILKVINTKGDVKSGLGILRLQYRVPCTYSKEATETAKAILQQNHDIDNKHVIKGFTITDRKERAIEAAYSVTLLESGSYRIGIHIVDPTSVIKKGDAIDKEAEKRGTDFYVNEDVQPVYMIPERLSKALFSIERGKERKTLTVYFEVGIDQTADLVKENFEIKGIVERSIFQSETQYTLAELQTIINSKRKESEIKILDLVSKHLRKQRLKNATFFTDINEMFPYENNSFIECIDAHLLVGELHIFANQTVAKFLFDVYPKCVPCKCHPRPPEKAKQKWKKSHKGHFENTLFQLQDCKLDADAVCSIFNYKTQSDDKQSIPIQRNAWNSMKESAQSKQFDKLRVVLGADEIHPMQALCLEEWIGIQETSEFKCSASKKEKNHFDLRVPIFTYFTAPLSRFVDLVVHRMVHAALDNAELPPYTEEEIMNICNEMNKTIQIQKQFRKSCLVFVFAHSLHNNPRVFNGFIQNVTNNDVELFYPTLRKLPRLSKILPLNLLKSKNAPEFQKEVENDRYFMTLKWKQLIYSLKRITKSPPNENYLRLDPNQNVQFYSLQKWVKIVQALFKSKTKNIFSLMMTGDESFSKKPMPASVDTVNDVSSEVRGGTFAQQKCSYSMSFMYGQLLVVQMCADANRGMLTPLPQLLDITPNVKICLQHVRDPLCVLTSLAKKSAKDKYASSEQYVDTWMPIFSMEVATQTVDDDSITINDLPITFRPGGGAFSLKHSYMEKRDIEFISHSVSLLSIKDDEKGDTVEEGRRFYMSGSDFLCIRCPLEPINDIVSNFGSGAISPMKRYWIGHAKVHDVKYNTRKGGKNVSVSFLCHNKSPPIPPEMLNKKRECSVEILPKSDVYRRTELFVKWLDGASVLAKAIALRKRAPDLDKEHREMGEQFCSFSHTLGVGLAYNDNQRKAIKKALTSSFSLIQGPPGTGKTLTGVALIQLFCTINQKYSAFRGDAKHFVVFCGPSNKSVDLVTANLKESFGDLKILRMYGSALEGKEFPIPGKVYPIRRADAAPDELLRDVSLHHIIRKPGNQFAEKIKDFDRKFKTEKKINFDEVKEYKKILSQAVKEEVSKYDVILCTTSVATSSRLLNGTAKSIYQLLIDEAGMCTEPECLATIVATQAKQVVLIGDHKQLRPVVLCQEAGNLGLQKSMFERYAESDLSEKVLTLLTNQYRMHPSLCRFPSYAFYDKKLVTKKSSKWEVLEPLSIWRDYRNPLVFCHTEGEEEYLVNSSEEGNEMSKFNRAEIDQVEKVFQCLVKREGVSPENINVMSQYNAQCSKIREKLKKYHVQNVNTVVASQGGEWDYVIFSLVRSLPGYRIEPFPTDGWRTENLGFINDDHQINVALTRARKGLVIIGNKELMKCNEVFKTLLEDYGRHGCIEDADQFPPVYKRKK